VPFEEHRIRNKHENFIDSEIRQFIKIRNRFKFQIIQNKEKNLCTSDLTLIFRLLKNKITIKQNKKNYYCQKISQYKHHNKKLWRILSSVSSNKSINESNGRTDTNLSANELNNFFFINEPKNLIQKLQDRNEDNLYV
jgi:hypothetical protein